VTAEAIPRGGDGSGSVFLDGTLPLAFAHRGGAGWPPNAGVENTLAAFGRAVGLGYRYLETDVRSTADGVAVLCHDPDVDRVAAGVATGAVRSRTWAQLSRVRVGGTEPFARLDELLDAFPDARVNVDVKEDAAVGPFLSALHRTGAAGRVGVASFGIRRAGRLRRALGPAVAVSATVPEVLGWLAAATVPSPGLRGAGRSSRGSARRRSVNYQVPPTAGGRAVVTARTVAAAHRSGRQVHVWTVDDPGQIGALLDAGVDGIITDRPDVLRAVLVGRGQWHG